MVALLVLSFSSSALAEGDAPSSATAPVTVTTPPVDEGDPFIPGTRLVEDLPNGYIEEEFFIEGEANLYNYANNPPQGPTDIATLQEEVPYKTRLIVRRPANAHRFRGTVVVEWWNSTAGFDTAPAWDPSAEYFAREGIIYVGVTNSTTSLGFLTGGCRLLGLLPPSCGTRYSTLSLPENGLAYDMMSQIANLLRTRGGDNPIPANYRVKRLFHVGESQQAGSLVTYASGFHLPGVNDGYFIQAGINARPINFGPRCGDEEAPAFPDCTPRLVFPDTRVRTDLPVPVYQLITQTDFEALGFSTFGRQEDTEKYRYYEVAGGSHNTVHKDIEVIPAGVFGPNAFLLEELCGNELNTTADGPVFVNNVLNALWKRMEQQVRFGRPAPAGDIMDDVDGILQRDDLGNVLGGVRLPSMEAPTATYGSSNMADPNLPPPLIQFGNLACRLSGSVFPFDEAQLNELYPRRFSYLFDVFRSTTKLRRKGLLLRRDAFDLIWAALAADVGGQGTSGGAH